MKIFATGQFAAGTLDNGEKLIVGVNNTIVATHFLRFIMTAVTPVSTTPAVNLPPLSATSVVNKDKHYNIYVYTLKLLVLLTPTVHLELRIFSQIVEKIKMDLIG